MRVNLAATNSAALMPMSRAIFRRSDGEMSIDSDQLCADELAFQRWFAILQ